MKIVKLIVIITAIALITCKLDKKKTSLSKEETKKSEKQVFSEAPLHHVGVPNDSNLLQHVEVRLLYIYNF